MKKKQYYEETLEDLEADLKHETRLINSLKKLVKELQCDGYAPLDFLNEIISQRESGRNSIKLAIAKLQGLLAAK